MRLILIFLLSFSCFASNSYYQNIGVVGTGSDVENYTLRVILHRGNNPYDKTNEDIFLHNNTDVNFSNVRFEDADGTELKHYFLNVWNGEMLTNNLESGSGNFIKSDGTIITSGTTKSYTGIQSSTDNGHSWTLNSAHNGILVGVSSTGIAFYMFEQKLYRSDDATLAAFTMVLDISGEGSPSFEPTGFCEDSSGNLYLGKYVTGHDVEIFKSTNAGATWVLCYSEIGAARHHVHSLSYNAADNRLYAGLDSDGDTKRLIISDDNGANWSVLQEGTDWDSRITYCGDGYRLFAAGAPGLTTPLRRTTDDINFTVVLDTELSNQKIVRMGDNLYLFCSTENLENRDNYAKIFKSEDEGLTWELIHVLPEEPLHDVFGIGWGYGTYTFNAGTPTISTEELLFLHFRGNSFTYPNARMYNGGDHYQTICYVKIPAIPAAGKMIKIRYGSQGIQSTSSVSNFPTLLATLYSDTAVNAVDTTTTLDHIVRSDSFVITGCTISGVTIQ